MTRTTKQLETLSRTIKSFERLRRDLVERPARLVTFEHIEAAEQLAAAMQDIQKAMVTLMRSQKYEPIRRNPLPYTRRPNARAH